MSLHQPPPEPIPLTPKEKTIREFLRLIEKNELKEIGAQYLLGCATFVSKFKRDGQYADLTQKLELIKSTLQLTTQECNWICGSVLSRFWNRGHLLPCIRVTILGDRFPIIYAKDFEYRPKLHA